jgi:hypothetical protein
MEVIHALGAISLEKQGRAGLTAQLVNVSGARQQNFLPVCWHRFRQAQFAVAALTTRNNLS